MGILTWCIKCHMIFEDVNYIESLPLAKRCYCNECIDKIYTQKDFVVHFEPTFPDNRKGGHIKEVKHQ